MYTVNEAYEWGGEKADRNLVKHGIAFKTAALAFDDPSAWVVEDEKHSVNERRQWLVGDSGEGVLVVVFTMREPAGKIRIVSARRANRRERGIYETRKGV